MNCTIVRIKRHRQYHFSLSKEKASNGHWVLATDSHGKTQTYLSLLRPRPICYFCVFLCESVAIFKVTFPYRWSIEVF
jgi:hypothetical protein